MKDLSVHGRNALPDHRTIAHITALLIASTTAKPGDIDRVTIAKESAPDL